MYYAARDAMFYTQRYSQLILIKYVKFHTPILSVLNISVTLSSSDAPTACVQDTSHSVHSVTCTPT
jgi:hypothetical protein